MTATPTPAPTAAPTATPKPTLPPPAVQPGNALLTVRLVDAAGNLLSWPNIGPEVLVYRAEPATCAFFRGGGLAGSDNDDRVVKWGHTKKDGTIQLEIPSPGKYLVLQLPNWWKSKKSCDAADVLGFQGDQTLDVVY